MEKQNQRNIQAGFWISLILRICLVAGLGAFIISTYLPEATSTVFPSQTSQPVLSLLSPQSATIKQGQVLTLRGEHFGANDTITFLLDSSIPIRDENGKIISKRASNSGGFDVLIPIQASVWSVDTHYIQATDNVTKQNSYQNIVVSPASVPEAMSRNLALFIHGVLEKKLKFNAVVGQTNPNQQRVTLANTSRLPLHWRASANADHNLSWLVIDDNHTAGDLAISGTDSIGISVLTTGLKRNSPGHPYTGQIVFTINGQEQLTLPVELQVADTQSELVFSPNPIAALLGAGNTCQLTAVTLLNLGKLFIFWTLVPYDHNTGDRIQFIADGQVVRQGVLTAADTSGDSRILTLRCNRMSAGTRYKFTIYANNASWLVTIFIQ